MAFHALRPEYTNSTGRGKSPPGYKNKNNEKKKVI